MRSKNNIQIYFDDEVPLLNAVKKLRGNNETIIDVLSPFPVHGMDEALSIRRSRIPVGGFLFGLLGAVFAFGFQAWVFIVSYPLIIGGKPFFAAPAFIPITFEVTVLFGGLSMVAALLIRSKLKPDIYFVPVESRITDDRFLIVVAAEEKESALARIRSLLSEIPALEIK